MNKKQLLIITIVVCLYFAGFYTTRIISQKGIATPEIPVLQFINCLGDDIAISTTEQGVPICYNNQSLYTIINQKKIIVEESNSQRRYFPSSLGIVSYTIDREFYLFQLQDTSLRKLYQFTIPDNQVAFSVLFGKNEQTIIMTLTCEKIAQRPADSKTIFYKFILKQNSELQIQVAETTDMLKIVNYIPEIEQYILSERYFFLKAKQRLLSWTLKPKLESINCENGFTFSTIPQQYCKKETAEVIATRSGNIIFSPHKNLLIWIPSNSKMPTQIATNIDPENWELVAKYSTRIGKRVYNCFDFSESLHLTLHVYIPEL